MVIITTEVFPETYFFKSYFVFTLNFWISELNKEKFPPVLEVKKRSASTVWTAGTLSVSS